MEKSAQTPALGMGLVAVRPSTFVKAFFIALLLLPIVFVALARAEFSPPSGKPVVEVTFVLDTTGSMSRLIEGAKRKIWSIATTIVEANPDAEIRMGLVAYRDIGDEYVTKTFPLTTDIQDLYAKLLDLRAAGGGDWPESVNEALHVAVTKINWTQGSEICRIMFLVGDAPPHMDYAQDVKYPEVMKIARERGIVVNAVQAGGAADTERVWRTIAQMGDGRYIQIPQDGGQIVVIETPYDVEIIELQRRIHGTVIPYGPRAKRAQIENNARVVAAAPTSTQSEMAGYMARKYAGGTAITGDGDLVADVAEGRQKLGTLKADDLPDTMRGKSEAEQTAVVDRALSERKTLNARMSELVGKRDRYVADKRASAPKPAADSFDRAVADTLRAQIKR